MESGGGAFGAGKAGGQFDPVTFIKKPQVIARLISLVRVFVDCNHVILVKNGILLSPKLAVICGHMIMTGVTYLK